ncbi:MAG: NAD(P)H-dependent oxidoreductase [Xanthomonadales bacterium]|jgi:NAD(P)H-dependent FMN reductase|nr:NAD(P)H-dependent oxidoreductase [Xanthomonadales bacterium]
MNSILAISGSLRSDSFNTALLKNACELLPDMLVLGSIDDIPLYNGDVEAKAVPESVTRLQLQLKESSGLLLASPEYNQSVPGVLKNTIDWLSRPSDGISNVFRDKPVAVMGASPGGFGTILAQNAWLPVFRGLGARQWAGGRLMVSGAGRVFDEQGVLQDEHVRDRLKQFVREFGAFCEA